MQLVIDIGNSRHKAALFDGPQLVSSHLPTQGQHWDELFAQAQQVMVCASGALPAFLEGRQYQQVGPHLNLPFVNHYANPQKLGPDRIALLAGAQLLYPGQHCLVIDAGTCITLDLLTADGQFVGGIISPGVEMRLKAMHQFTARLPLLPLEDKVPALAGLDTAGCMQSGAINGARAEVAGTIAAFEKLYAPLTTVITGGHHPLFENLQKEGIFAEPFLLMQGCNYLLLSNA